MERQQLQALRLPSAFSAALGKSLQSAPDWMWSQAWESGRRCPPSPAERSSTHLLAAFLLTWVARRPLPKQRRVVRRRARAPAGRNLVTRRRRRTRTRPQLRGTLVPTCSEWSRAAYPTTHLQQQLGLVQSGLSSLTNGKINHSKGALSPSLGPAGSPPAASSASRLQVHLSLATLKS